MPSRTLGIMQVVSLPTNGGPGMQEVCGSWSVAKILVDAVGELGRGTRAGSKPVPGDRGDRDRVAGVVTVHDCDVAGVDQVVEERLELSQ